MTLYDFGITPQNTRAIVFFCLAALVLTCFLAVLLCAVRGYSVQRIAKALGEDGAWQAFVPVIGDIALSRACKGRRSKGMGIAAAVLSAVCTAVLFIAVLLSVNSLISLVFAADSAAAQGRDALNSSELSVVIAPAAAALVWLAVSLVRNILSAVLLSEIYRECGMARGICVLNIFLPVLTPVLLYSAQGRLYAASSAEEESP